MASFDGTDGDWVDPDRCGVAGGLAELGAGRSKTP